jgi:hypothetical protein
MRLSILATADGTGVEGVDVIGDNGAGSTVTAADGSYSIIVPNHWDGTITVSKTGWLITPVSRSYTNVVENLTGQNYIAYQPKISGYATKRDGTPLAGVLLSASNGGGNTISDTNGYYELIVPYDWSGRISASLSGYRFSDVVFSHVRIDRENVNIVSYEPKISGIVSNKSGMPLASATINADNGGGSDTTGADGYYEIYVPYNWTGLITVSCAGYYTTLTSRVDFISDQVCPFMLSQPTISGSTGIAGVSVTISGVGTVTSTPNYSIDVPVGWSGTVDASLAGYDFTDSPKVYTNVTTSQTGQNFTPFQPTISGSTIVAEAIVTVSGVRSVVSTPEYSVTVPYGWSGAISAEKAGFVFTNSPRDYTNVTADEANQDFIPEPVTISGYLKKANGIGLEGATVTADNGGGMDTTDADGFYELIVPCDWSGAVETVLAGYHFPESPRVYTNVIIDMVEQNFTAYQPTISGSIVDANGIGLEGVTISDSNNVALVETDPNGSFVFTVPYGWSGMLIPTYTELVFEPPLTPIENLETDIIDLEYTAYPPLIISGHVTSEGIPLEKITITDQTGLRTTQTDLNGYYEIAVYNGWSGIISAIDTAMTFSPVAYQYTNIQANINEQNFTQKAFLYNVNSQVSSSLDDACQGTEYFYYSSRPFFYNDDTGWFSVAYENISSYERRARIGTRFYVNVPKNANITDARISLKNKSGNYLCVDICGELNPNPQPFTNSLPTANLKWGKEWYISMYDDQPDPNEWMTSPDFSSLITIIVALPGWRANNPMVLILDEDYRSYPMMFYSFYSYDDSSENAPKLDISYEYPPLISGYIRQEDDTGVGGITLTTSPGDYTVVTEPNGFYQLRVPPSWTGIITPSLEYWTFEANQREYHDIFYDNPNQDFMAIPPVSLSGFVRNNIGEPIENITIIADPNGETGTTNANGEFSVLVPFNWSGSLTANQFPYFFDPMEVHLENVTMDLMDLNFEQVEPVYISGTINDVTGNAVADIQVEWNNLNRNTVTDAEGYYELTAPLGWSGTISTSKLDRTFEPFERSYEVLGSNWSNQDFIMNSTELHVYADGSGLYPTIQQAIDAAVDRDHVIIHPGRYPSSGDYYYKSLYFKGKAIIVRSIDPTNPEIVASTIVDGRFFFDKQEGRDSVLDGLTISGSVYCQQASPTIRNCVMSSSIPYAYDYGLISTYAGNPYIQNCTFVGMQLSKEGNSAIIIEGNRDAVGDTIIENCLISLKYGYSYPYHQMSGIQIRYGHADIINTTIAYCLPNIDESYPYTSTGTALSIWESDVSIKNSIIWGNYGSDNVQITLVNHSDDPADPLNANLNINYSTVEGGRDNIMIYPDYYSFDAYWRDGILPDPNLVDPNTVTWGPGNMDIEPLFVREPNDSGDGWFPILTDPQTWEYSPIYNNDYGDLHLKSETGRFVWDGFAKADFNLDKQVDLIDFSEFAQVWGTEPYGAPLIHPCNLDGDFDIDLEDFTLFCDDYLQPRVFGAWVVDEVTSPCIDAGDPADAGWQGELWPHGGRINMGAYGGTAQASMSPNPIGNPADLNHDGAVDLSDWGLWSDDWLDERILLDSDFDRDSIVDPNDLDIFLSNWLWME